MGKPAILHIAPIGNDPANGVHYAALQLVLAQHQLGAETMLINTHVQDYTGRQPYEVLNARTLSSRLSISQIPFTPDIVIFHSTYLPLQAALAREYVQRGTPYVITPHGSMTRHGQRVKPVKKLVGNLLFFRRMVDRAAMIHCLTDGEEKDVRAWGCPTIVAGNGMTLPPEQECAQPGQGRGLKLVFVGRLHIYQKGLDLFVDACRLTQNVMRNAGVQVEIYGPDLKGSQQHLKEKIAIHQLEDLVTVHGPVYDNAKLSVLKNADVFFHTSRFEGHSIAVLEALAYGLPCLLTEGTNMAGVVDAAGAGWAAQNTPEDIAARLLDIVSNKHQLPQKGSAARQLVYQDYSWANTGKKLLDAYRQIIKQN